MEQAKLNWLNSLKNEIEFYQRSLPRKRYDQEFDWPWFEKSLNWKEKLLPYLKSFWPKYKTSHASFSLNWLEAHVDQLWQVRQKLADQLSQLLFDAHLLVNSCGYGKYYFPRIDFQNLITFNSEQEFNYDLPKDYIGLPLKIFDLTLNLPRSQPKFKIISTNLQLDLLNSYRQYLITRGNIDFSPCPGEIALDCGACIGDLSVLFSVLVGSTGQVHAFEPVPFNVRYCQLNAELNTEAAKNLKINTLAVGSETKNLDGQTKDSKSISPSGLMVNSYSQTTIDDYVKNQNLLNVDYIKMDIEGWEIPALEGAKETIGRFKPRLAISTYHLQDDLWKIADLILKLNPDYCLYFGHHSPKSWESVYYAIDKNKIKNND